MTTKLYYILNNSISSILSRVKENGYVVVGKLVWFNSNI